MLEREPITKGAAKVFNRRLHTNDVTSCGSLILVFVEVRYRRSDKYGSAADSVDQRKQEKILRTAKAYLAKHTEYTNLPVRFDVVAVSRRNCRPKILWIRDAFQ